MMPTTDEQQSTPGEQRHARLAASGLRPAALPLPLTGHGIQLTSRAAPGDHQGRRVVAEDDTALGVAIAVLKRQIGELTEHNDSLAQLRARSLGDPGTEPGQAHEAVEPVHGGLAGEIARLQHMMQQELDRTAELLHGLHLLG